MPVNSKGRHINQFGQITRIGKLEIKLTKQLQDIAREAEIRIRPLVRDKAEQFLREEIDNSYKPATKSGASVQEYNATHSHQKANPYHHTGLLVSSVYATIEGDTIKTKIRDKKYEDGTSTIKVYDVLKFGTPKTSKKQGFYYNNHSEFSPYISQEPHNFETRAKERIDEFLDEFPRKINSEAWRKEIGIDRYIDKVAQKNR